MPHSNSRKTEGGSKNLAAAFAVRAVERENIHLNPPAQETFAWFIERLEIKGLSTIFPRRET